MSTHGIHHITAICSNAQRTVDFYTKILGLRFVKKTVNFDAPDTYHLYFGNETGEPGTALTFFPFRDAGTGMRGLGQVTKIYFGVNKTSLGFWLERFILKGIKHEQIKTRFNESYITFFDPDGLQLEIVGTSDTLEIKPWGSKDVPLEHAICGFYGAELAVESLDSIKPLLSEIMGYEQTMQEDLLVRFENKNASSAKYLDLLIMHGWPEGINSAGTNHHIAFRVNNKQDQQKILNTIRGNNFRMTEIVERYYFSSIYFREKNNILFEIATDEPGFTIDEDVKELGTALKLPPQYKYLRTQIEAILPELHLPEDNNPELRREDTDNTKQIDQEKNSLFSYKFVNNNSNKTIVLLHGTGGDEIGILQFTLQLGIKSNILSIRGNVSEYGMNRYYVRFSDGSFDNESLKEELEKLNNFLEEIISKNNLENNFEFLGYSNGANFALAFALSQSNKISIQKIYALHPVAPALKVINSLENTEIIVTYADQDAYSSPEKMAKLQEVLKKAKAKLELKEFIGGHEISEAEMEFLKNKLNS